MLLYFTWILFGYMPHIPQITHYMPLKHMALCSRLCTYTLSQCTLAVWMKYFSCLSVRRRPAMLVCSVCAQAAGMCVHLSGAETDSCLSHRAARMFGLSHPPQGQSRALCWSMLLLHGSYLDSPKYYIQLWLISNHSLISDFQFDENRFSRINCLEILMVWGQRSRLLVSWIRYFKFAFRGRSKYKCICKSSQHSHQHYLCFVSTANFKCQHSNSLN